MQSPNDSQKSSDPQAPAEIGPDRQFELALVRQVHDLQNSLWPLSVEAELGATDSTLPFSVSEIWGRIGRSVQEAMTIASRINEVVEGHFNQKAPRGVAPSPPASRAPVSPLKKGTVPADPIDLLQDHRSLERDSPLFQQPAPGAAAMSNRAANDEPATTVAPQAPARPMRILCVDNDANVLATLSRILKHLKHEVVVCQSGSEALALFAASRYDVVMTDLDMTGMDGRAVTRKIRASSNTPVIWATCEDFSKGADRIDESEQPDWVLPKPVSLNSLRQALAGVAAAMPTR